jgi:hypothetical protein
MFATERPVAMQIDDGVGGGLLDLALFEGDISIIPLRPTKRQSAHLQ